MLDDNETVDYTDSKGNKYRKVRNSMTQTTGIDGKAYFKNLDLGDIYIREKSVPSSYQKSDKLWNFYVDDRTRFLGEVSSAELISGDDLANEIGLNSGTAFNSDGGWLKYHSDGKVLFVAKKPFRYNITWGQINVVGAVDGTKTITIGENTYKVRLMKGGNSRDTQYGSEWNRLILPIIGNANQERYGNDTKVNVNSDMPELAKYNWFNENCNVGSTDEPNTLGANSYSGCSSNESQGELRWMQDSYGSHPVLRGSRPASYAASYWCSNDPFNTSSYRGWLPVLELATDN